MRARPVGFLLSQRKEKQGCGRCWRPDNDAEGEGLQNLAAICRALPNYGAAVTNPLTSLPEGGIEGDEPSDGFCQSFALALVA
jgi:hypothetical protein